MISQHNKVISGMLALIILLASALLVQLATPARVKAQGNTKGWKVIAIAQSPGGAAALQAELDKGGWEVHSLTPGQLPGPTEQHAYTLVVLKSRIVSQ